MIQCCEDLDNYEGVLYPLKVYEMVPTGYMQL